MARKRWRWCGWMAWGTRPWCKRFARSLRLPKRNWCDWRKLPSRIRSRRSFWHGFFMLETARMRLLPWQADDWLLLRPIATDPRGMRYISDGETWPGETIRE